MSLQSSFRSLVFAGAGEQSGSYLLRLHVLCPVRLALGQFRGGQLFTFPPGPYLYIGSALATQGAASLPRRLLRHATRQHGPPHPLRAGLQSTSRGLSPPGKKRLHWHIDFLLEEPAVTLTGALVFGGGQPLEAPLAAWLHRHPLTTIPIRGAGASDAPGQTHLFAVWGYPGWWADLCRAATYRFAAGA